MTTTKYVPPTKRVVAKVSNNVDKKHHPPRFAIHEIPKMIRFMRYTQNRFEEANAWERYLEYYQRYERDMKIYNQAVKQGEKLRMPWMPAPPNSAKFAPKKAKEYKRPLRYQGAKMTQKPYQVQSGSLKNLVVHPTHEDEDEDEISVYGTKRANYETTEVNISDLNSLVEVEKLNPRRGLTMRLPTVNIPVELSDYLEGDSEPNSP